mmetsp:Transcript_73836/g.202862  ORF Transcript_73836/g.202862 Transcript_73836/m.202862 type:complete len:326 (-) Transcript_73836:1148-2125(-)
MLNIHHERILLSLSPADLALLAWVPRDAFRSLADDFPFAMLSENENSSVEQQHHTVKEPVDAFCCLVMLHSLLALRMVDVLAWLHNGAVGFLVVSLCSESINVRRIGYQAIGAFFNAISIHSGFAEKRHILRMLSCLRDAVTELNQRLSGEDPLQPLFWHLHICSPFLLFLGSSLASLLKACVCLCSRRMRSIAKSTASFFRDRTLISWRPHSSFLISIASAPSSHAQIDCGYLHCCMPACIPIWIFKCVRRGAFCHFWSAAMTHTCPICQLVALAFRSYVGVPGFQLRRPKCLACAASHIGFVNEPVTAESLTWMMNLVYYSVW